MSIFTYFQSLKLTSDQESAIDEIGRFLNGDQEIFLLKGYAGTGKTTLLHGLCRYLSAQNADFRLMAPTGRAAMILSNKTGISASTIHRGIFNMDELAEKEDGNSFKFFYKLKVNEDSNSCVYLIDEASMVSDVFSEDEFFMFGSGHLLKDLSDFVFSGETKRKIIFIGDDAQLPPVNMNFSPGLDGSYLREKYGLTVGETTLRQVVRQEKGSGILNTATSIRESLQHDTFNQFSIQYGNGDIQKSSPESFLETYVQIAKNEGLRDTIIITHSNRQALDFNLQVRELRYGSRALQVQKEDWLLITKNNYNGPIELFNGMFARVIEVGGISYTTKPRFTIKGGKTVERELIFRDVLVEVEDVNGEKHQLKTTLLDRFLTAEEGRLHPYDQRALYIDFKERMRERGIRPGTDTFREALKDDLFFNALQAKYGYAITCHKSQGGEWNNAIIDFKVYMGKLTRGFFRWAYTAITRASNRLYCIDAPEYNALSNFVVSDIEKISKVLKGTFYVPQSDDNPMYFLDYRQDRIKALCREQEIDVQFTRHNNQLDTTFHKSDQTARVQLWYNQTGFSKTTWIKSTTGEFSELIQELLVESLLPEQVPFDPKFPFQQDLHQYLIDLLREDNIPLTNVVQNDWNDQYFIYTGTNCALLEFWYNGKSMYTHAKPKSTLGEEDTILKKLAAKLQGV